MRALEGQGGPDGPVYLWSTRSSPCWGGCSGRRHGTLMNVMWLFLTSWLGPGRVPDWAPRPPGRRPIWVWWGVGGLGMMVLGFLFWVAVIVALVLGIRWLVRQGRPEAGDSALEILRQRYARGEINREEVEAKRKDLQRSTP